MLYTCADEAYLKQTFGYPLLIWLSNFNYWLTAVLCGQYFVNYSIMRKILRTWILFFANGNEPGYFNHEDDCLILIVTENFRKQVPNQPKKLRTKNQKEDGARNSLVDYLSLYLYDSLFSISLFW